MHGKNVRLLQQGLIPDKVVLLDANRKVRVLVEQDL
jgi:hypothetical protein